VALLSGHAWKRKYTPDDGDLVRLFYVPALEDAVRYDRLTGYFSASALTLAARGIEGLVSEVIGPRPQIVPKKHGANCGKVEGGAAEDRCGNGAICPRVSVVLGDVIEIGESARRSATEGPISRLRE
jgi:hypothetical protein